MDSLLRGGFDDIWVDSPTGFGVPRAVRTVDDIYLHPELLYSNSEFEKKQKELNRIRREAIDGVGEDLHPAIKKVFH